MEAVRGQENRSLKRSGRPQKISAFDRDLLYDTIQQDPNVKYDDSLDIVDYKISRDTLRRLLKDFSPRKGRKIEQPQSLAEA